MVQDRVIRFSIEVIRGWDISELSPSQEGDKNYIAMNREGIKQGYISPKVNDKQINRKFSTLEKLMKSNVR